MAFVLSPWAHLASDAISTNRSQSEMRVLRSCADYCGVRRGDDNLGADSERLGSKAREVREVPFQPDSLSNQHPTQ